jgi:DNA modification methylase
MSDQVDPRNRLNDLSNRQWLIETKSFWRARGGVPRPEDLDDELLAEFVRWLRETHGDERAGELLGQPIFSVLFSLAPPRDELKATHPATFSERDIERLLELFTKTGQRVLDPFVGTGSTLIACHRTGRAGVGIELIDRWRQVTLERLSAEGVPCAEAAPSALTDMKPGQQALVPGDAREVLSDFEPESFDFVVTSPPYWRILTKKPGDKTRAERTSKGLPTRYSDDPADLGNVEGYEQFLAELGKVFAACRRVLRPGSYMCVIVCDFRHGPKFHLYHADVARVVEGIGLPLKGVTILCQDSKNLYPLGIPYAFVSNIHHQYVLIFQKMAE